MIKSSRVRISVMVLQLIALSAHCVNANSARSVALLVTTFDPKIYSAKSIPASFVLLDYSREKSLIFRLVDRMSFPGAKWVYMLKTSRSDQGINLEAASAQGSYFSHLDLNAHGRFAQIPVEIKLSKAGLQVAHASEPYMIGLDYTDYSISTVCRDTTGNLRLVSTYKLSPLNHTFGGQMHIDAVPVDRSGGLLVSEALITPGAADSTILIMLDINSKGIIHESSNGSVKLDGLGKVIPDFPRSLVYVLASNFWTGIPKIHQYRILPNGKLLEINIKASALGDVDNETAAHADSQDLKKVFPAPPSIIQLNPILVQSLKLCSRRNLLFGFGGTGYDEVYVWSVGKNGIDHLLHRYHLVNDLLVRGATQASSDQNPMPAPRPFNSFLDSNEDYLYATRSDYGALSQKVYKFKISNDGQLTSVPLDVPIESDRMISDMEFIQY